MQTACGGCRVHVIVAIRKVSETTECAIQTVMLMDEGTAEQTEMLLNR